MAITVKAAAPFSWFGQSYLEGDTVDTAGYDGNSMRRLLRLAPVYVESAASGPLWVEHVISLSLADYDQDGAGTWTDGAALSQTDPTADSTIWLKQPLPSLLSAVEASVLLASGQDAGITAQLAVTAGGTAPNGNAGTAYNQGEGFTVVRSAAGDTGSVDVAAMVDSNVSSGLFDAGITADAWTVVGAVVLPNRQNIYVGRAFLLGNEIATGGNAASQGGGFGGADLSTDRVGISAIGLCSFRAIRVWTLALPAWS